MTDAETIIARVLLDHDTWDHNCVCGEQASDPSGHVAAEVVRALRDAALLPEATVLEQWGAGDRFGHAPEVAPEDTARNAVAADPDAILVRRTRTTYADHVTEWEPAE